MNWQKFAKNFNGWISFAVGTALFFAAPPLYRIIDPTAGQFDAGYLHPIIYALCAASFAQGFAWFTMMITAPGLFKTFDSFLESSGSPLTDNVRAAFWLYLVYFIGFLSIIIAVV